MHSAPGDSLFSLVTPNTKKTLVTSYFSLEPEGPTVHSDLWGTFPPVSWLLELQACSEHGLERHLDLIDGKVSILHIKVHGEKSSRIINALKT